MDHARVLVFNLHHWLLAKKVFLKKPKYDDKK